MSDNKGGYLLKFLFLTIITVGIYPVFRLLKALVRLISRSSPKTAHRAAKSNSHACPYCGAIQDPPPQRKRKCRDCGQTIHVKKLRDGHRKLLTEKEVRKHKQEMREAHWKDLSNQGQRALQEGDWHAASQAYHGQARILFEEGRNHHIVLSEAHKCELLGMREVGIQKVKVLTADDERVCQACQKLDGKVFSVSAALKIMPIPCQSCDDRSEKNPHGGFCRCVYVSVFT